MNEKWSNLIDSAKGEIQTILLEEAAPILVGEMIKGTVLEGATQAMGIAVPGLGNIMISYKQKKLEKNFERYISAIVERQNEINMRLSKLEEKEKAEIQSKYFGLVADYASQSKQEEKINLIANGFVNVTGRILSNEDVIMMYYDTLEQLTMLDIRVLRLYANPVYIGFGSDDESDDMSKVIKDYNLDFSQLAMIKEKLERLGLLESRNDIDMDENMRNMAQYLNDFARGKKNPKLKSLKKISKSESYKITTYGHKLIKFFTEIIVSEADTIE